MQLLSGTWRMLDVDRRRRDYVSAWWPNTHTPGNMRYVDTREEPLCRHEAWNEAASALFLK